MPKFRRPCLKCGGTTSPGGTYCDTHERELGQARNLQRDNDPKRKEKKKLLYNSDYQKARREIVAYVRANGFICYLCNKPIELTQDIDIDHVEPANPNSQLLPTHRTCNRSRGNRPANTRI